jgi:hypothetical protein
VTILVALAISTCLISGPAFAQNQPAAKPTPPSVPATQQQNLKEYVALLRKDVRSEKFAVMDAVMQLDLDQSAKFWPIYRDYDAESTKLNDLRVANIQEYARTYSQLTDAQADALIQKALSYQKQRNELLARYYDRMKQAVGAVTAARFVQVENQLLQIIDLQIESSLPLSGS